MGERLLAADAARGVEGEHLGEEVDRERVRVRVQRLEGDARLDGQRADVVLRARRADAPEGVFGGRAEVVQDLVELVDVAATSVSKRRTRKRFLRTRVL